MDFDVTVPMKNVTNRLLWNICDFISIVPIHAAKSYTLRSGFA